MTKNIATIKHINEAFRVVIGDKSQAAMIAEIKAAGYTLSRASLAALIKGEKEQAGDFKMEKVKQEVLDAEAAAAAPAPKADKKAAADKAKDALKAKKDDAAPAPAAKKEKMTAEQTAALAKWGDMGKKDEAAPAPAPAPTTKTLTAEQAALAAEQEKLLPTQEPAAKVSHRGTDWTKVLPQEPVAVLKDSMLHRLFVRLCDPAGATKEQLMSEFGWSAGGLGGIIHWEPKAKGYLLESEKKDGKLHYHLAQIGTGRRYHPEEILIREKAAAAPKAAKEPKAPKEPKAAPAPKVPKAAAPVLGTAAITKRVATKKAAQA